mmetsp:Transcript_8782/g.17060  ORF Transcript_8782/g.17060 Transcript_8782/m.17060 type:complete len:234 (+) Transcript_8782:862-1563(+)
MAMQKSACNTARSARPRVRQKRSGKSKVGWRMAQRWKEVFSQKTTRTMMNGTEKDSVRRKFQQQPRRTKMPRATKTGKKTQSMRRKRRLRGNANSRERTSWTTPVVTMMMMPWTIGKISPMARGMEQKEGKAKEAKTVRARATTKPRLTGKLLEKKMEMAKLRTQPRTLRPRRMVPVHPTARTRWMLERWHAKPLRRRNVVAFGLRLQGWPEKLLRWNALKRTWSRSLFSTPS